MSAARKTPSDFLKSVLGRPVVVRLNSGFEYHGSSSLSFFLSFSLVFFSFFFVVRSGVVGPNGRWP
jgi:hypothetical protein